MNLDPYLSAVLTDLDRATSLADEQTRQVAAKVASVVEPALRLAMVHALSDAAAGITSELTDTAVVVTMEGRDPVLSVHRTRAVPPVPPTPPTPSPPEPQPEAEDGETARVTVRLPQSLKAQLDRLAVEDDLSLNTWVVRALRRAVTTDAAGPDPLPTQSARRVTGWA